MGIQVKFQVTGHGQLNGNLRIDKTVEMDNDLANRLRVDKKALLKYVETQYPGAKVAENSLSVRISPIPKENLSITQQNNENNQEADRKEKKQKNTEIDQIKRPGLGSSPEPENVKKDKLKLKNEIEELKDDLVKIRLQKKNMKIAGLKDSYSNRKKDFTYFLKLAWLHLDTGWKKALAIFVLWLIIASIYKQIIEVLN